jgi:50S ribosomal protein L16 3-hydroxylase
LRTDRFDADSFLRDSWQKRPQLIRNPWAQWANPIDPDELAGLACEDGVEARLVEQARKQPKVEQGPFAEARFSRLKKNPWALLVQAVDQHVPDVAALIEAFRFVPNWRIDDVMVSYATDGGGVGAHFDQYDVFLVQGLGRRRWQVGQLCDTDTPLLPHDELRLLADFRPTDEWVLEPGDILYVPPRIAHDGVALGDDCMTYSIGFRAPSRAELIAHWCDHLLSETSDDDRYADPDLIVQANPGEIAGPALDRLHAMVAERLADRDAFARWFGGYTSTRKYPDTDWTPEQPTDAAALRDCLAQDVILCRNPASRFAFVRQHGETLLFVDGACIACSGDTAAFAERLCASDRTEVGRDMPSATVLDLIGRLFNAGSLAIEERG